MELRTYLKSHHIDVTEDQADLLTQHLLYVQDVNNRVQMTTIRDFNDGMRLHILDSLTCLAEVNDAPAGKLLDIGSGGGFPGIPLAITTGRDVMLLDSVKKKMRAIQEFIDAEPRLSNVSTSSVRAEELALDEPDKYAVVTARALSSLPSLIELATPLLMTKATGASSNGRLIALKGRLEDDEIQRGDRVAHLLGMKRVSLKRFVLSESDEQRAIVVYERSGLSKRKLPRRNGLAQKMPLA